MLISKGNRVKKRKETDSPLLCGFAAKPTRNTIARSVRLKTQVQGAVPSPAGQVTPIPEDWVAAGLPDLQPGRPVLAWSKGKFLCGFAGFLSGASVSR